MNFAFQQICAPYSVALRTNSQIVPYSRFHIQDTEAGVLVGDKKEKFAGEFERGKSVQRLSGYCFQKSFYPDNCYASGRSIDGPQRSMLMTSERLNDRYCAPVKVLMLAFQKKESFNWYLKGIVFFTRGASLHE
ncbi:hypothetical protein [Roseibium album]|uniref:hypothetical protein n=1 Tax=Roseibium album TaxID=311410 RepID=UPI0011877444|nr:hypothetical protein [Roseibium album]